MKSFKEVLLKRETTNISFLLAVVGTGLLGAGIWLGLVFFVFGFIIDVATRKEAYE